MLVVVTATDRAVAQYAGGGVKAGWNISTLSGDATDPANVESINGLILGGFLRFSAGGGFSVQPELLFSRKGP